MPFNQLNSEFLSISGIPDTAGNVEAIVGDAISFVPQAGTIGTLTTTLARKPAGSSATVSSNSITFDVAGWYTVTVLNGGYTRTINVVVFPSAVLSQVIGASGKTVTRGHLRQLVTQGGPAGGAVSIANMAASLEAATATLVGVLGNNANGVPYSPMFQAVP